MFCGLCPDFIFMVLVVACCGQLPASGGLLYIYSFRVTFEMKFWCVSSHWAHLCSITKITTYYTDLRHCHYGLYFSQLLSDTCGNVLFHIRPLSVCYGEHSAADSQHTFSLTQFLSVDPNSVPTLCVSSLLFFVTVLRGCNEHW